MTFLLGSLLIVAAVVISNAGMEQALLGEATGVLSWGPALFRVLLAVHGAALIAFALYRKRHRSVSLADLRASESSSTESEPTPVWIWISLVGLTVLGGALRLWKLDSCLWYDEIDTVVNILRDPLSQIVTNFSSQNQHMFFSVLARTCISIFGEGAAAVRLPSVMFGLLSVWALFLLGRRTVGSKAGLLACCLMTLSYHHVWFSQNARGYMGLLFFTILATWLLIEARGRSGAGWWIAYAISLALGSWTHMTMVFVAVSQAIVFVFAQIGRRSDANGARPTFTVRLLPLLAWVLSGTLTVQLYALGLPEFLRSALHEASAPSEWTNPLWVVQETIRNLAGAGVLASVAVAGGGFVLFLGWLRIFKTGAAVAWMMVLPGVLAGGTMMVLGHNLWPRFFFFCMGFAILLAIAGVYQFTCFLPRGMVSKTGAKRLGTILVVLMIVGSAATLPRNYAYPKQDFTGARDYVERERKPNDGVVGVGLAGIAYDLLYAPNWGDVQEVEVLNRALEDYPRLWLVYTLPIEVRAYHPGVWEVITERFETVKVFPGTLGAGEVTVCRSKS